MESCEIVVEKDNGRAVFDKDKPGVMSFHIDGQLRLRTSPLEFGPADESSAVTTRLRQHETLDGMLRTVETGSLLPFGSEPEIHRRYEFTGNRFDASTRILLKKGFPARKLQGDSLLIAGDWKFAAIAGIPAGTGPLPCPEWKVIPADGVIHSGTQPFLFLMLADSEGSVAETGHSGPLSRWGAGKTPPGAMFTVKAADGGVMVERTLETRGTADDDIVPGGVYNLKWYFAHGKISDFKREDGLAGLRFPPLKKNPSKFTLDFEAVAKQFSGACPFLSPPLWASLKKWVRKSSADGKKRTLCLTGAAPSFSGGDKEPVWDISELLDFHLWANRHLAKSGSRLLIFPPKNSPAHQMPSLRDIAV